MEWLAHELGELATFEVLQPMKFTSIKIETVDHSKQVYPTVGDWRVIDGVLVIRVSRMGNWKYEMLVAVHELVEVLLCKDRGITTAAVDAFDKAYEAKRKDGDDSEPGDHKDAPYKNEHFFASNIERLLAAELAVDWESYDKKVNSLP